MVRRAMLVQPKKLLDALAGAVPHPWSVLGVVEEAVDRLGQVVGELGRVFGLEVGAADRLERHEQARLPGDTTSLIPPTAEATTGVSQAIASRLMMPNGS